MSYQMTVHIIWLHITQTLYWSTLSFKAVADPVNFKEYLTTPWKFSSSVDRQHLTMKLQSWGTSYPTHNCETKTWFDWVFKPCNLTTWRKQFLHYAFHSSLQEYCGEDVTCSTGHRNIITGASSLDDDAVMIGVVYSPYQGLEDDKIMAPLQSCLHNTKLFTL